MCGAGCVVDVGQIFVEEGNEWTKKRKCKIISNVNIEAFMEIWELSWTLNLDEMWMHDVMIIIASWYLFYTYDVPYTVLSGHPCIKSFILSLNPLK